MIPNEPHTAWTREQIEEWLKREKPRYQRIALPYGLSTGGEDRSDVARAIFPDDMRGKSVLDVGCFLGFLCHEAIQRGAGKVVGVDIDPDRLAQARTIADILGRPIDFRLMDIEQDDPGEKFDYVLFLNVLHHVREPISVLNRLIRITRERLVLEVAGADSVRPQNMLKELGAWWFARKALRDMPVIVVGRNGTPGRGVEQKFFFSAPAFQHLFMHQRQAFARLERKTSSFKDRYLLIAHRRRVGELLIMAGPSGAGKSTLMSRIFKGDCGEIAQACGLARPAEWLVSDAKQIARMEEPHADRMLYHYDLLHPWGRDARLYSRDEGLDVMGNAERVRVATCMAKREVLIERLERERAQREKVKDEMGRSRRRTKAVRRIKRIKEVLSLYRKPERMMELVEDWIGFCRKNGAEMLFVDTTAEPKIVDVETWKNLLK
ncbi:MAG: methyltransferase domain-containing protein [Candidatus Sumerlaeota bacterium]|nr:methyltransferase domain-containing protein [Candidatus Sumerlaeota bacterium]